MFSDQLIVLTYIIRDDAEQRGYAPWLRAIDNKFFNSVPQIGLYENWKAAAPKPAHLPWTHFDLLHPAKGVDPTEVFQVPVVVDFASKWSELWGVDPYAPDQSVNYQIHILERVRQGKLRRGELLALVIDPDLEALPAEAELWQPKSMVVGDNQLGQLFALQPLTLTSGKADPRWGREVIVGECIASPLCD